MWRLIGTYRRNRRNDLLPRPNGWTYLDACRCGTVSHLISHHINFLYHSVCDFLISTRATSCAEDQGSLCMKRHKPASLICLPNKNKAYTDRRTHTYALSSSIPLFNVQQTNGGCRHDSPIPLAASSQHPPPPFPPRPLASSPTSPRLPSSPLLLFFLFFTPINIIRIIITTTTHQPFRHKQN